MRKMLLLSGAVSIVLAANALAGGPDVIVGDLPDTFSYGEEPGFRDSPWERRRVTRETKNWCGMGPRTSIR